MYIAPTHAPCIKCMLRMSTLSQKKHASYCLFSLLLLSNIMPGRCHFNELSHDGPDKPWMYSSMILKVFYKICWFPPPPMWNRPPSCHRNLQNSARFSQTLMNIHVVNHMECITVMRVQISDHTESGWKLSSPFLSFFFFFSFSFSPKLTFSPRTNELFFYGERENPSDNPTIHSNTYSMGLLFQRSVVIIVLLLMYSFRLTQRNTRTSFMASKLHSRKVVCEAWARAGHQPSLATLCRGSASLVSMKCSRSSTVMQWER